MSMRRIFYLLTSAAILSACVGEDTQQSRSMHIQKNLTAGQWEIRCEFPLPEDADKISELTARLQQDCLSEAEEFATEQHRKSGKLFLPKVGEVFADNGVKTLYIIVTLAEQ